MSLRKPDTPTTLEPPLLIDAAVQPLLLGLARQAQGHAPEVAERLLAEIERADIRPAGQLPGEVVTLDSFVTYQDADNGSIRTVQLVLPAKADLAAMRVSVISPIGAALIGLSSGQSIRWEVQDKTRTLTVLRVSGAL